VRKGCQQTHRHGPHTCGAQLFEKPYQRKGKEGDTSSSAARTPLYTLGAQPGGTPRLRSVAAEPRCNSAHQDADYWSLLLHHSALGVAQPCALFCLSPCRSSSPLHTSSATHTHTHTQPAPRPRHTVSRYVLCLILVGNTDHIIVIVQSCAARGAKMVAWWGTTECPLAAAGWRCPEACWTPSAVGPERWVGGGKGGCTMI
jgi:hypothetical protein